MALLDTHKDNGCANNSSLENKNAGNSAEIKTDLDSSEISPCLKDSNKHQQLSDSKHNNKRPYFYEPHLLKWQKKTGLSRKWLLIVLALIIASFSLLITILGLSIGWPKLPHKFQYPLCKNPTCLKAAAQLQSNLNPSISPCKNLWKFVCAQYAAKNSTLLIRPRNKPQWNLKEQIIQKEFERIRDEISQMEPPLQTESVEWKMKNFYDSCMDVDSMALDGLRPLEKIISELGGWYILRKWNEVGFNGMKVLAKLQVRYGVSPFFKVNVEANPHKPNFYTIRISPSGLGLPDKAYYYKDNNERVVNSYMNYIRDLVISMSTTQSDAAKFSKDIFNYEKRLAEITPDLFNLQNPISIDNAITLDELKSTTSMIPLHDIIQAIFPDFIINENTEVIVTSLEYLAQVAQIISSTDRRMMNGYLIWTLVRENLPYLIYKEMSGSVNLYNNELFGISEPVKRWEICSQLVGKFMPLAVEFYLGKSNAISNNNNNNKAAKTLNSTFNFILKAVKKKLPQFGSAILVQHLQSKLNSISFHVEGIPKSTRNKREFLEEFYAPFQVLTLNWFENIQNAYTFQRYNEQKLLLNIRHEEIFLEDLLLLKSEPKVRYVPSKNAVIIPRSFLMDPFYVEDFPSPIIYGRIGVEIANAILSSILPYGSLWTSDKKILSPFHMTVNQSINSVQLSVQCLSSFIRNDVDSLRINETALRILKELYAVEVTLDALKDSLSLVDHIHFSGLEEYEDSAIYFITYAQTKCTDSTFQYKIYENILNFKLPNDLTLDLVWRLLPDFKKTFQCPVMNDEKICLKVF